MIYILELNFDYFRKDVFSKNDAFRWMISNSADGKISHSLRKLATIWQWHYSSVKRFLDQLHHEKIININIHNKINIITIINYKQYFTLKQSCNNICNNEDQGTPALNRDSETVTETRSQQTRVQHESCNYICNSTDQEMPTLEEDFETVSETISVESDFQEKKKRSKKRKELFIKEKNIPYGDTKKEKTFQINQLSFQHITIQDIELWAREALPINLDLQWELEKFQDYWNSIPKKPPKDGLAAFRNWLRKAVEIKLKNGDHNDGFNYKNTNRKAKTSDFERFLTGGARALDEINGD